MAAPHNQPPRLLPKVAESSGAPQQQQQAPANTPLGHRIPEPSKRPKLRSACDECKRKKTRCDGTRPSCLSCVGAGVHCRYAAPEGLTARQADRQNNESYRSAIELLREGSFEDATEALKRIRGKDTIEDAVTLIAQARLLLPPTASTSNPPGVPNRRGDELDIEPPLANRSRRKRLRSPHDDPDFMFDTHFIVDPKDVNIDPDVFVTMPMRRFPIARWTSASTDEEYMNHLLMMFFTWDNIVEKTVYRPVFEEDLQNLDPDVAEEMPQAFCTRFLVNSLLALSCLYTLEPRIFKIDGDRSTRGRMFADEAYRHLESIEQPSITLLQGLIAIFCYEGVVGSGERAVQIYTQAMETYRLLNASHLSRSVKPAEVLGKRERQALSWCMWGFYCCEWRSSEAFGFSKLTAKPHLSKAWREPDFPLKHPDCVGYWRSSYPMSFHVQDGMKVAIRESDAALSEIAEDILNFLHPGEDSSPLAQHTARAVALYDALNDWKTTCPEPLRFETAVLPAVILLHTAVELLQVALLRPFAHLSQSKFGRFSPKQRCYTHANALISRIWTFRSFSVLRFEYWLNHAVGTAAFVAVGEPEQLDTLARACQCLHEMSVSLPLAVDVLSGIRSAFDRCGVEVPGFMEKYFSGVRHREDGLLHHAVAALMPGRGGVEEVGGESWVLLQELLDGVEDLSVD